MAVSGTGLKNLSAIALTKKAEEEIAKIDEGIKVLRRILTEAQEAEAKRARRRLESQGSRDEELDRLLALIKEETGHKEGDTSSESHRRKESNKWKIDQCDAKQTAKSHKKFKAASEPSSDKSHDDFIDENSTEQEKSKDANHTGDQHVNEARTVSPKKCKGTNENSDQHDFQARARSPKKIKDSKETRDKQVNKAHAISPKKIKDTKMTDDTQVDEARAKSPKKLKKTADSDSCDITSVKNDAGFTCDLCQLIIKTLDGLKRHKKIVHEKIRYPCRKCGFVAISCDKLVEHLKSKHDYIATNDDKELGKLVVSY